MASHDPLVHFFVIPGGDHFSILAPLNRLFASRIMGAWSKGPVTLDAPDVMAAMGAK